MIEIAVTNSAKHIVHLVLPADSGKNRMAPEVVSFHPAPAVNLVEKGKLEALQAQEGNKMYFDPGKGGPLATLKSVPELKDAKR